MLTLVRRLEMVSTAGLYLVLTTPLLVWPEFMFPHLTSKVIAFQVLVEIALGAAGISLLLGRTSLRAPLGHPLRGPLAPALGVFFLYSLLSAIAGVDVRRSLWGFVDRQDGLVLHLHFLVWAGLLVSRLPWNPSPIRREADPRPSARAGPSDASPKRTLQFYANASYWISVCVAGTALAEWFYVRFLGYLPTLLSAGVPGRVSGVLGNPVALGPYLLVHFFYGTYYLRQVLRGPVSPQAKTSTTRKASGVRSRNSKWGSGAWLIAGAQALLVWIIFLGETRGVILGLLFGLFIGALALIFVAESPRWVRRTAVSLSLGLLLGLTALFALRDTPLVRNISVLDRLTHISTSENQSTRMRLMTWQSAWRGFKDRPLLGWGHDNIYYALNRYYNPKHVLFIPPIFNESKQTWYDKSHNAYLDLLVEKGSVGALLFLACALALLWSLKRIQDRFLAICLLAGFAAYGVTNFFAFDTFASLFGAYLLLSIPVTAAQGVSRPEARRQPEGGKAATDPVRTGAAMALAGLLAIVIYFHLSTSAMNARTLAAQRQFPADPNLGIASFREALAGYSPYAPRHMLDCAYSIAAAIGQRRNVGDVDAAIEWALGLARESIAAHPLDAATYMFVNDMLNNLALERGKRYTEEALSYGTRALELSPGRQEAIFYLGRTYVLRVEPARAVELNRRMVADVPEFAVGHWFLGLSLMAAGDVEEGKKEILRSKEMGYRLSPSELEGMRKYFDAQGFELLRR